MDGYTYMLARNRRLIDAEAAGRQPGAAPRDPGRRVTDQPTAEEQALRNDVVALYRKLEGCGR